jgi:hypothetical protein
MIHICQNIQKKKTEREIKYLCWVSGAGNCHPCITVLNLQNYNFTDTLISPKPYEPDRLKIYFPS